MNLERFDIDNYQPTTEERKLAKLLTDMRGNISATVRAVGRSRRAIYHRIEKSPFLKATVEEARETILNEAESVLFEAVKRGEGWAVCFLLKTIGKNRGYSERTHLDVSGKVLTVADLAARVAEEEKLRQKQLNELESSDFEN